MGSGIPENFDRLAFNGPLTVNSSPAFALESQNLGRAALGANSLTPITDSSLVCSPLPQYGARSVGEVQQVLSSVDANISPKELVRFGIFQLSDAARQEIQKDSTNQTRMAVPSAAKVNELNVVFSANGKVDSDTKTDSPSPDFLVGKNGSITMLADPDKIGSDHKLVIALEGDGADNSNLPQAQEVSLNLLSEYLGVHYKNSDGSQLAIHDKGLIAPAIKQALGAEDDQVADQTQQQSDRYKQLQSQDHAYISPQQAESYSPAGDKQYQYGSKHTQALENTIRGYNLGGHKEGQYYSVHNFGNRGWAAGTYPLTRDMFLLWLCDLAPLPGFGPADIAAKDKEEQEKMIKTMIERLRKAGKLTPELCDKLESPGFQNLMERLQQGGKLTPEAAGALRSDIEKYLPSSLQEFIGNGLINDFSKDLKAKYGQARPEEVTLSMLLGHTLTDGERTKYKDFLAQASSANELSYQHLKNPNEGIYAYHVTGNPSSPMAFKLASHFMDHAKTTEPGGYCAGKLSTSMGAVGLDKWRNDAPQMAQAMLHSGQWVAINPDKAAPGDVVYRPHSSGRGGHIEGIAAVGPQGYLLASDFHHTLKNIRDNNNGYYSGLTVMRYVGPGGAKDLSA